MMLPPTQKEIQIVLGPRLELHTGIHGELAKSPPPGVTYVLPRHRHRFLASPDPQPFDPFRVFTTSETVQFALPAGMPVIIHSSRTPVFDSVPWLADADCLLATLSMGTFYALGCAGVKPPENVIRVRQRVMLSHYLSDHCMGILFRTEHARRNLLTFVESRELLTGGELENLHHKTDVLRPTLPPLPTADLMVDRPTIIYMGRFENSKGAQIALPLFHRLNQRYGRRIRLIYVGPPPPGGQIDASIESYPVIDREQYLTLLASGHIYLSPTEFESFGFGLVEAARFGLAIVTSCGQGMEHIDELFQHENSALLVPTDASTEYRLASFEAHLRSLVENREKLLRMRTCCLDLFQNGPLSIAKRDKKLLDYYSHMLQAAHQLKQSIRDVQNGTRMAQAKLGLVSHVLSDETCADLHSRHAHTPRRVLVSG